MISYDLAKKLKDAGFPIKKYVEEYSGRMILPKISSQTEGLMECELCNSFVFAVLEKDGNFHPYCIPTLSELIETCGDGLQSLSRHRDPDGWFAYSKVEDEHGNNLETLFSTPEEAVANLWLALQDKK